MTTEEFSKMQGVVERGQKLCCEIMMVKQELSWLEGNRDIEVGIRSREGREFPNTNPSSMVKLTEEQGAILRGQLTEWKRENLKSLEREFAELGK